MNIKKTRQMRVFKSIYTIYVDSIKTLFTIINTSTTLNTTSLVVNNE